MSRARDLADSADKDIAGTLTLDGLSVGGDVALGDNNKAIFGAGSDLQIYHDGSNSYIHDGGTGSLNIRGTDLYLRNAGNEVYVGCLSDGQVYLRYDNVTKLSTSSTGIDVTGTVTSDGLTVDGVTRSNDGYWSDNPTQSTQTPMGSPGAGAPDSVNAFYLADSAEKQTSAIKFSDVGTAGNQSCAWIASRYTGNYSGDLRFYTPLGGNNTYDNSDARLALLMTDGVIVFNEDSNDMDFRVEGADNNKVISVDADKDLFVINSNGQRTATIIKTVNVNAGSSVNIDFNISAEFGIGSTSYFHFEIDGGAYGSAGSGSGVYKIVGGGYSSPSAPLVTDTISNTMTNGSWSWSRGSGDYTVTVTNTHGTYQKNVIVKMTCTWL